MVVIRSFPFGCTIDDIGSVISTSSYREAGNRGVVWRRADSFGPPDGVGARSDVQDILDGAVAILLLEMSAAEFTDRHVFDQYRVYEGSGRLRGDGTVYLPKNSLSVGVNGDRMSRASILGQDQIATLEGSVRGSGRYSFPQRSAETTVITAATASTATAYISYLS